MFSPSVKAVLLYRAETWRITKDLLDKLQVFVSKCLKTIRGIRWPERITKEDLWHLPDQ